MFYSWLIIVKTNYMFVKVGQIITQQAKICLQRHRRNTDHYDHLERNRGADKAFSHFRFIILEY